MITCLGNSLAYVRKPDDLAEVFGTFAVHSRPGTLLIISTLNAPVLVEPKTHRVDTADLHGEVTISYEWEAETGINTMFRRWCLDDGETSADCIWRRVVPRSRLSELLVANRFDQLSLDEGVPNKLDIAVAASRGG